MIARIQQLGVLGTALAVAAWLFWCLPDSPGWALAGAVLLALGWTLPLGLQFTWMARANRRDPAPRAGAGQVLRAAGAEVLAAARVFGWRQPFRSRSQPDWLPARAPGAAAPRGVVLVHGFLCNRGIWLPWLPALRARGHAFEAVNLEPVFGAIDDYVPLIDAAVRRVAQATGRAPLLLCHSMGGLAVRAWLQAAGADARVHRVVTLGTPHGGTALARFAYSPNGRQMRVGGDWLALLQRGERAERAALFTCWYSNCDQIVFPASTAALPGATHRFIAGVAHVQMACHPQVLQACLEALDSDRAG
ncbi:permease [Rhodococcus sp. SRB_17]|nr:permease [Rhodococcus sp. SRB_17]